MRSRGGFFHEQALVEGVAIPFLAGIPTAISSGCKIHRKPGNEKPEPMRLLMAFRIRNLDVVSERDRQACEQAYLDHLKTFEDQSHSSLWKFFATDFFRDGAIRSISFEPGLRSLVMQIECPNIKRFINDGYELVKLDFICEFRGVSHFTLQNENPSVDGKFYGAASTFIGSEINSIIPKGTIDKRRCSLILEARDDDRRNWIEFVFSNMSVVPEEPVAFAILEADSRFHIPVYKPDIKV